MADASARLGAGAISGPWVNNAAILHSVEPLRSPGKNQQVFRGDPDLLTVRPIAPSTNVGGMKNLNW